MNESFESVFEITLPLAETRALFECAAGRGEYREYMKHVVVTAGMKRGIETDGFIEMAATNGYVAAAVSTRIDLMGGGGLAGRLPQSAGCAGGRILLPKEAVPKGRGAFLLVRGFPVDDGVLLRCLVQKRAADAGGDCVEHRMPSGSYSDYGRAWPNHGSNVPDHIDVGSAALGSLAAFARRAGCEGMRLRAIDEYPSVHTVEMGKTLSGWDAVGAIAGFRFGD